MALRVVARVAPIAAGLVATFALATQWARPAGRIDALIWWVALFALSAVVMVLVERVSRRLLPLSALFSLSLAFPDQAPSRFRAALRSGNSRSLLERRDDFEQGIDRIGDNEADYVVELLRELSSHDRLTRGHIERVRAYSHMIGEELGLSPADLDRLQWAALLHDVGKLDVPAAILSKPGGLDDAEYATVKQHPGDGGRWVAPLRPWLGEWLDATTQHHERVDGTGYPLGLNGKQMSVSSRIIAVADAYDVITATRSYKPALSAETARHELTINAGTQFDATMVRAFLNASVGEKRSVGVWGWILNIPILSFLAAPAAASVATGVAATVVVAGAAVGGAGLVDMLGVVELGDAATEVVRAEVPDALAFSDGEGFALGPIFVTTTSTTDALSSPPPTLRVESASNEAPPFVLDLGPLPTTAVISGASSTTTTPSTSSTVAPKTASSTTTTTSTTTSTTTTAATSTTTTAPPEGPCDYEARIAAGESLAGCDLSGADLAGRNLKNLDFTGANLAGADLTNAILVDAIFANANLTDVTAQGARANGIDLSGATLDGADFSNAQMSEAELQNASAIGAIFDNARLGDVDMEGANLTSASLVNAVLGGMAVGDANFTNADLTDARGDVDDFASAIWTNAICPDGSIGNCRWVD